jgi:phospholipid/cholesterol/gamma-HCH transport system substrate-binding protein
MDSKREQALVGIFVLVAASLLIATVFLLSGTFARGNTPFRAYFNRVGGVSPGAEVRYNMGPPVGRVTRVRPDPGDPRRMEVNFSVKPDTPVKTDCIVVITSNSPLSDNYLSINCDMARGGPAPSGYTLKSEKYKSFGDIGDSIAELTPQAKELIENLNGRITQLKDTIDRVNDLLNDENRANISASLSDVRGMLHENRPAIHGTINNLHSSTAKLDKLLDDFKKTLAQANDTLAHVDSLITENRPDLRDAIIHLRETLASTSSLSQQLDQLISTNSEELDEIIENMAHVTENLKEFTDTIKTRPYTLLRSPSPKEHVPGQPPSK